MIHFQVIFYKIYLIFVNLVLRPFGPIQLISFILITDPGYFQETGH